MTEQERFEKWASDRGLYTDELRLAWECWQAAIESKAEAVKSFDRLRAAFNVMSEYQVLQTESILELAGRIDDIGGRG